MVESKKELLNVRSDKKKMLTRIFQSKLAVLSVCLLNFHFTVRAYGKAVFQLLSTSELVSVRVLYVAANRKRENVVAFS